MYNKIKLLFGSPFFRLFCLAIIAFWQVAFLYSSLQWDMLDVHLPWLTFMSEVLQSGELHYWNPYQELGYPFHADLMSTWYPLSLIVARFIGFNLYTLHYFFLLHIFIAGCGMYKLSSFFNYGKRIAFAAAVAYMLCGFFVSHAQHLIIITSAAWIPFVLYYFLKISKFQLIADAFKLSIVSCLMLMGGYAFLTIVLFYFLVILFSIIFFRNIKQGKKKNLKTVLLYLLGAALTLAMSSPMIISLIQVFPSLERGSPLTTEVALSFPYTLHAFWLSLIPFSLANNWEFFETDISMVNIYSGIILAIFMVYGLWKRASCMAYIFFVFGLICLLGALSKDLPFMRWMVLHVPFFNFFRFPAFLRLFFIIGAILFAAGALHSFSNSFEKERQRITYCVLFFIALIAAFIFYGLYKTDIHNLTFNKDYATFKDLLKGLTLYERIALGGGIQLLILLVFLFVLLRTKNSNLFLRNTMILIIVDLFIAVQTNINYTVVDLAVDPIKTEHALEALTPHGFPIPKRTSMVNAKNEGTGIFGIWRNINNFTKEPAIDGFSSFWLNDYLLLEKDTLLGKHILDNPIVYLSSSVFSFGDLALHKKNGDIHRKNIYLSETDMIPFRSINFRSIGADTAYFLQFGPNRFKIKVISSGEQVLTLLQSAYRGWHVTVAGKETNWVKSNYLFMSVLVPKGQFEVDFIYENKWVKNGFIVASVIFFLVLTAISFLTFRSRRAGMN